MRKDLNKVLCEHERNLSDDHYSNYRHLKQFSDVRDLDEEDFEEPFTGVGSGHRESMKYRYGYNAKSFGENLNPLWGIVRKNVGRPWDKVYGEICAVFDKRSVINQHILTHLFQGVCVNVEVKDGALWVTPTYGNPTLLADTYVEYYVDPADGILKRNKFYKTYKQRMRERAAERAAEEAKTRRVIDDTTELRLLNGVWFEVKFEDLTATVQRVTQSNPLHKNRAYVVTRHVYPSKYDVLKKQYVEASRYARSKRTLSHKELKQYGLVI